LWHTKIFVRQSSNASDSDVPKTAPSIQAHVLDLPYKEIFPPDAEIFSLAKT
jgi:hypothetical protein